MNPTVYVETSVVSHLTGRLSQDVMVLGDQFATREWWQDARTKFELVASPLVVDEAGLVNTRLADDSESVLESLAIVAPSEASEVLIRQLTDSCALSQAAVQDTAHIAIAVANGVEYLATWNFRHIANPARASKIDQVCRNAGYRPTIICTPRQLMEIGHEVRDDPILAEIREYRDLQAARFGYDAAALIEHVRNSYGASDHPRVQYPSRRLKPASAPETISGSGPNKATPAGQG